jgi:hypothetical protein
VELHNTFFAQTSRFAGTFPKVVQLGAADVSVTVNLDLFNAWRAQQEGTLDANTIGSNTANGEVLLVAPVS